MASEQPLVRTWMASGTWRYSNIQTSDDDGTVTHTYQYRPEPTEARSDLENDAMREHGYNVTVGRVVVCEVLMTHLFDA
jgi:hypothetical protein